MTLKLRRVALLFYARHAKCEPFCLYVCAYVYLRIHGVCVRITCLEPPWLVIQVRESRTTGTKHRLFITEANVSYPTLPSTIASQTFSLDRLSRPSVRTKTHSIRLGFTNLKKKKNNTKQNGSRITETGQSVFVGFFSTFERDKMWVKFTYSVIGQS